MYTFEHIRHRRQPREVPDANPTTRTRPSSPPVSRWPRAAATAAPTAASSGGGAGGDFKPLARVEIIAPAAPGSGWDQTARAVQEALTADDLARSADVKNVPGASGTVALAQVAPAEGQKPTC